MGLRDKLQSAVERDGGAPTPSGWEYKVVDVHALLQRGLEGAAHMEFTFNTLGKDGWELVTIVEDRATFKRPRS